MKLRAILGVLAIGVACAACRATESTTPSTEQVSVFVRSGSVPTAGASLPLELVNASESTLGYNLCTNGRLERLRAGQWVLVDVSERVCTLDLRILAANTRRDEGYRLPTTLEAGTYRLVVKFTPESAGARAVSALTVPFTLP